MIKNAGDSAAANLGSADIDGDPRTFGASTDIGADEAGLSPPTGPDTILEGSATAKKKQKQKGKKIVVKAKVKAEEDLDRQGPAARSRSARSPTSSSRRPRASARAPRRT